MKRILNKYALDRVSLFVFGLFLISLYSCDNKSSDKNKVKRNILFYIGSDSNSLDNGGNGDEPKQKIDAIRKGWQPGKGEMLIYTDQTSRNACLLRVNEIRDANGYYGLDTLEVYENDNSADAEVLSRVINKVARDYPAEHYGMIFFSHASGWLPEGTLSRPLSLVIDNGDGDGENREMEYYDFAAAIPDGRFDFIVLEACLMADVLSMYELRNKAEYILAASAEIVSPGYTYIYSNEIMRLYDVNNTVSSVLSGFAQAYYSYIITSYEENQTRCSATLSLIKTDEVGNLASVVKSVLQGAQFDETNLNVSEIQYFDPAAYTRRTRYFDLGHAMENLVSDSQYEIFNNQLNKTVIWKAATKRFFWGQNGYYINYHSGLTTYVTQSKYPFLNSEYEKSSWYKAIQ